MSGTPSTKTNPAAATASTGTGPRRAPPANDAGSSADGSTSKGRKRVRNPISRYMRWLHTMWPAGTVEKLPRVSPDGERVVYQRRNGEQWDVWLLELATGEERPLAMSTAGSRSSPTPDRGVQPP